MNNDNKIVDIYEAIINGEDLTASKLEGMGINGETLSHYIAIGLLTQNEVSYSLLSTTGLYEYGTKLQKETNYGRAAKCFKLCLKINENDYNSYLQLVNTDLSSGNYGEAYDLMSASKSSLVNKIHDNNLHLLLLAGIKPFTDEAIVSHIKSLRNEDVMMVGDNQTFDKQNRVRGAVLSKKFTYALELLNNMKDHSIENTILKTMLIKNIETQEYRKRKIKSLVCERKYADLASYLSKLEGCPGLNTIETATLFLARKLIDFSKTEMPLGEEKAYNLFQAIYTGNYKQALLLSKEYNERSGIKEDDNSIYLLLLDMVRLIESTTKEDEQKEEMISVEIIAKHIQNNDFDSFEKELKRHLKEIGQSKYELLIFDLIKLSCLQNDYTYAEPIKMLNLLTRGSFKFEISDYIHKFFLAIDSKRLDEAQLFLDIIAKSKLFGEECETYDYLKATLDNYKTLSREKSKRL